MLLQLLAVLTVAWLPLSATALGLGEVEIYSRLGEPLQSTVELRGVDSWTPAQLNATAIIEARSDQSIQIQASIVQSLADTFVVLSSRSAVEAPLLAVSLQVETPQGKVQRSYTLALTLPGSQAAKSSSQRELPRSPALPAVAKNAGGAKVSAVNLPIIEQSVEVYQPSQPMVSSLADAAQVDSAPYLIGDQQSDSASTRADWHWSLWVLLVAAIAAGVRVFNRTREPVNKDSLGVGAINNSVALDSSIETNPMAVIDFTPTSVVANAPAIDSQASSGEPPKAVQPFEESTIRSVEFSPMDVSAEDSAFASEPLLAKPSTVEQLARDLASCYENLGEPALAARLLRAVRTTGKLEASS